MHSLKTITALADSACKRKFNECPPWELVEQMSCLSQPVIFVHNQNICVMAAGFVVILPILVFSRTVSDTATGEGGL